jgi:hypothetical protein
MYTRCPGGQITLLRLLVWCQSHKLARSGPCHSAELDKTLLAEAIPKITRLPRFTMTFSRLTFPPYGCSSTSSWWYRWRSVSLVYVPALLVSLFCKARLYTSSRSVMNWWLRLNVISAPSRLRLVSVTGGEALLQEITVGISVLE